MYASERAIMGESRYKRSFSSITRKWALLVSMGISLVFLFFAFLGDPGRGMAAAVSAGMIAVATRYFWDLRQRTWFWIAIGFIILINVPLIVLIPWPFKQYSYVQMLPIGFLDFAIAYGIIRLLELVIEKKGTPDS
jgi:hypothetical protein